MSQASRLDVIHDLKERLRQLEQSQRPAPESVYVTDTALDRVLPRQGLLGGTLTEWLSDGEGTGAVTLTLALTAGILQAGGFCVVVDSRREFYPPAAASLGLPLEQTVVVHPTKVDDALWTLEQALRSPAVAVALGWLERVNDRGLRRLQLAAEAGGCLGFLLRPAHCRTTPSWAELRLLVETLPTPVAWSGRRLRVEVLYCRGGASGDAVELELSHEAGFVRLAPPLAHSASTTRAAGA
jgi:cell division inhibitor SulA/protein ImuA